MLYPTDDCVGTDKLEEIKMETSRDVRTSSSERRCKRQVSSPHLVAEVIWTGFEHKCKKPDDEMQGPSRASHRFCDGAASYPWQNEFCETDDGLDTLGDSPFA